MHARPYGARVKAVDDSTSEMAMPPIPPGICIYIYIYIYIIW